MKKLTDEENELLYDLFVSVQPYQERYEQADTAVRDAATDFAKAVLENVEPGYERNLALQFIRQATMWASDGLLRNQEPPGPDEDPSNTDLVANTL